MTQAGDSTRDFAKVSGAAMAVAGAALGALVLKAASDTIDYTKSIMRISRVSGETIEASSRLAFAAQQSGVSTDQLANGIKFLEKNMVSANPEFDKLGVSVRDSNGVLRGSRAVLLDTAGAIANMANGAEKTAAILKIFGRAGLDLQPMLNKGRDGLIALEAEATKFGLVLSQDNVVAVQANIKAHRELDAAMMGAKLQIGQSVIPALTALTNVFAQLPGPVASAIVPVAGLLATYALIARIAPTVVAAFKMITVGTTAMTAAISGGALVAIGLLIADMKRIDAQVLETQTRLSGGINWKDHDKATAGLNAEIEAVNRLGEEWNNMSGAEKLANRGKWAEYTGAAAQLEEDNKHFAESAARLKDLGQALGVSGDQAKAFAAATHSDLTGMDPSKYIPIFRALAAGTISAAEAQNQLAQAARASGGSAEDQAAAIKAQTEEVKALNDAEAAQFAPQNAVIAAQKKLADAHKGVAQAEQDIVDAQEAVVTASQRVEQAERRRQDAAERVTDAIRAQRDAQRALNDLLAGPTQDERLNVEAAQIALIEAQRRAKGIKTDDPELERRKNALDVARAEASLRDAEGAHARNVDAARVALDAANKAVADARQAEQDAAQGIIDAEKALGEFVTKVTDAQEKAKDAQLSIAGANIELDAAARNLELAFATGATSMDLNREALDRWVEQGRITKDQADLIKKAMDEAKAAADRLTAPPAASADAAGTTTPFTENVFNNRGYARGGVMGEGWSTVGEEGPEAIYKRGSRVQVSTASASRALLVPHPGAAATSAASGAGGFVHNGDIIIGTATERTAKDIAWEQRRLALSLVG